MFNELAERSLMSTLAVTKHTYVTLAIVRHCKIFTICYYHYHYHYHYHYDMRPIF